MCRASSMEMNSLASISLSVSFQQMHPLPKAAMLRASSPAHPFVPVQTAQHNSCSRQEGFSAVRCSNQGLWEMSQSSGCTDGQCCSKRKRALVASSFTEEIKLF